MRVASEDVHLEATGPYELRLGQRCSKQKDLGTGCHVVLVETRQRTRASVMNLDDPVLAL